jgi:hypothetical protein
MLHGNEKGIFFFNLLVPVPRVVKLRDRKGYSGLNQMRTEMRSVGTAPDVQLCVRGCHLGSGLGRI